ncbi:MAG TPA: PIN domain-containing protein [Flavobacteriaceae bacterium]|nr:PIN domain-containing protein [Flavobacteriaceae bacterium]
MKKLFLDTNILVDLIADRKPHSKFAVAIFTKAEKQKVKLFTSSHSIATCHYLLKKYMPEKKLRIVLYNLLDYVEAIAIDESMLRRGLKSPHKDFEDGLQILAAYAVPHIDFIVTRNIRDFKTSEITVLSPNEVLMHVN